MHNGHHELRTTCCKHQFKILLIMCFISNLAFLSIELTEWYCQYQQNDSTTEDVQLAWRQIHYNVTEKNNNVRFEVLHVHYRLYRSKSDKNRVRVRVVVFNATFNNISVISWRSVLLVEETRVPEENHRPVTSHCHTLSLNAYH